MQQMSKDELEILIIRCQCGDTRPLLVIWNNVQALITNCAASFLQGSNSIAGVTFEDLHQESYFTMLKVIKAWTPESNFYGLMKAALRNDFIRLTGQCTYQTAKALNRATSLDAPLQTGTDAGNAGTLSELIPDTKDDVEEILHILWLGELRFALEQALSCVTKEQAAALWRKYGGKSLSAKEKGLARIGLSCLKRDPRTFSRLESFMDTLA